MPLSLQKKGRTISSGWDKTEGSLLIPLFPSEAYLCGWGRLLAVLTDLGTTLLTAVLGGLWPWEAAGWLLGLENRRPASIAI